MMTAMVLLMAALAVGEHPIPQAQGTHCDPSGHTIEVTTKCLRLDGRPGLVRAISLAIQGSIIMVPMLR